MFTKEKQSQEISDFSSIIVQYVLRDDTRVNKSGAQVFYGHQCVVTVQNPETKTVAEIQAEVDACWNAEADKRIAQYEALWQAQEALG